MKRVNNDRAIAAFPPAPMVPVADKMEQLIPATQFQAVTFFEEKLQRQVIILYALGADGIVREYVNGQWNMYPIMPSNSQVAPVNPPVSQ